MELPSIPIVLVAIGVLVLVLLLALIARQLLVSRSQGSFECILLRRTLMGSGWQQGLMRFGTDRLRWFHAFSLRLSPSVVIKRSAILDVSRQRIPSQIEDVEDTCLVELRMRDGSEYRFVVDLLSGAALNAWLEAAPTGMVAGDAD